MAYYISDTPPDEGAIGSDVLTVPTSQSGDPLALQGANLVLSQSYVSGTEMSGESVWDDTTISALGLTLGTYTWTWGSGVDADSLVVDVGGSNQPVPEPAPMLLMLPALGGLLLSRRPGRKAA